MKQQIIPTIAGLIILFVLGWYLDSALHAEIVGAARITLYALVVALVVALGGVGLFSVLIFRESYLRQKARRRQEEKEADVHIVVSEAHGVFIREMNHRATWRNATTDPRIYANGSYTEPTEVELATWGKWVETHAKRGAIPQAGPALLTAPEAQEAEPMDLIKVFTQPTQSYAIIGGQQTGKTFQANHIANYWLRQGLKPVVIGPKWDRGEWAGCYLLGGGGDFDRVEWGINKIRRLAESRHADPRGHKEHRIQPVFFDDWTPIVDAVPSARALVLEATTLYASVNIILYFILHSDTASAWGVDRKGAALKQNFIKLFLVPQYDGQGLIVRSLTRGYIRFAGESVDRPARLFSTLPVMMGEAIEVRPVISTGPDETEARIIALHEAGNSFNEIARQVFGSTGGHQVNKIKQILGV